jgi:hypothetical protein
METWTATTKSEANFGVDRRASDICRKIRPIRPSDVGRESVRTPVNGPARTTARRPVDYQRVMGWWSQVEYDGVARL